MIAREGYSRIVIWQPTTGYACDVAGWRATGPASPSETNEAFRAADGSDRTRTRERVFEATVLKEIIRDHLKRMRDFGCPVKAVAFGPTPEMWQEGSRLQMVDAREGFGRFAGGSFRIVNRVFDAAIWQGGNLLEGVPWFHTSSVEDNGTFFLEEDGVRTDYQGPKWEVGDGDSVDASGFLSGSATLAMELPSGRATLRLTNCEGVISALDFSGSVLDSAIDHTDFELPGNTWSIEISLTSSSGQPLLSVVSAGKPLDPRIGAWTGACSDTLTAIDGGEVDVPWDECFGRYACDSFDNHANGTNLIGQGAECGPVWVKGRTVLGSQNPQVQDGAVWAPAGSTVMRAIINAGRNKDVELFCRGYFTEDGRDDNNVWSLRARGSPSALGYWLRIHTHPNGPFMYLSDPTKPLSDPLGSETIAVDAETWFEVRWVIRHSTMEVYYRKSPEEVEELIISAAAPNRTEPEFTYFGIDGTTAGAAGDFRWDDFCVRDIGFADTPDPVTGLIITDEDDIVVTHDFDPIAYVD